MLDIDPTALGLEFGAGALVGALVGFGAKRVAKLLAVIVGVQLVAFRYLESQGIVVVHWDALTGGIVASADRADPSRLESLLTTASLGVGFVGGFLIGYHRG